MTLQQDNEDIEIELDEVGDDDIPDNFGNLARLGNIRGERQGMNRLREVTNTVVSLQCRERECDNSSGAKIFAEV